MIYKDVCIIAGNTARSKAYLQMMVKTDMLPNSCIVYVETKKELKQDIVKSNIVYEEYFDIDESIISTLDKANVPYNIVENRDINSEELANIIKEHDEQYMIYSGYGGQILKSQLFTMGKRYIHVHAGILPKFRGSTTIYYSYLSEKTVGATAIFLSETIDTGDIICEKEFKVELKRNINVDYVYEPWLRSLVLIDALKKIETPEYEVKTQESIEGAETYYIIHPVLKHIALLGMEGKRNE